MVVEQVDFRVEPERAAAFEADLERGLRSVMQQAAGLRGYRVERCVEEPGRYVMRIAWERIEDHLVGYRQGPLSATFKAIVEPYLARAPEMRHFETLVRHDVAGDAAA